MDIEIRQAGKLQGTLGIPGDKSISHRGIMLGALADGTTRITNFLQGADCLSTIRCFQEMGISVENRENEVLVRGKGLHGLTAPAHILDVGNSGTTTRLISGILSGQEFASRLTGDSSIQSRPMGRIMTPLTQMGAKIESVRGNGCAPLDIRGSRLRGIHYQSPVASAQVKSCILLAGLYADNPTSVTEPYLSRDHSERMLKSFGARVTAEGKTASIQPDPCLTAREIEVPGDISSAAYFIAAALLVPNSQIRLLNVGTNPTRNGILKVCKAMGAQISMENVRSGSGEPSADLIVTNSPLRGTDIGGDLIPTLIDEIPVLAVLAAYAQGDTVIRDAAELKVKESNRIDTMVGNLSAMGADITATKDGMVIHGGKPLHGARIQSYQDHRIAMSFAVAGLAAEGTTTICNGDCVDISYPGFYQDLQSLFPA